jgi:hypothetical protein
VPRANPMPSVTARKEGVAQGIDSPPRLELIRTAVPRSVFSGHWKMIADNNGITKPLFAALSPMSALPIDQYTDPLYEP